MDKSKILNQIHSDSNLLSLPQVLSEIIVETAKEDFSPDKLGDIILKDPALTGRILKMSNSAFYNRRTEIKTVHQAISVMGVTTVKCLALSTSIFHPSKVESDTGIDAKKYFAYILSVATASKKIAVAVGHESPEETFIAGLLHDIGNMYLMHYYPKQFVKILSRKNDGKSINQIEEEVLGINHTEISRAITEEWKLPAEIIEAVSDHHNTEKISRNQIQNIVKLAILLSNESFTGYDNSIEDRMASITKFSHALDLDTEQLDEITSTLLTETLQFAEYLNVEIGDIEHMLTQANQEIWKSYIYIEKLYKERQELSQSLLHEEHHRGAIESKNIAMATLSHYLNNAVMAIFGRTQLVRMNLKKNQHDLVMQKMPEMIDKIEQSVRKIVAVIEEMKEVSPIDQKKFDSVSKAMNIDDRIESRLAQMEEEGTLYETSRK